MDCIHCSTNTVVKYKFLRMLLWRKEFKKAKVPRAHESQNIVLLEFIAEVTSAAQRREKVLVNSIYTELLSIWVIFYLLKTIKQMWYNQIR